MCFTKKKKLLNVNKCNFLVTTRKFRVFNYLKGSNLVAEEPRCRLRYRKHNADYFKKYSNEIVFIHSRDFNIIKKL